MASKKYRGKDCAYCAGVGAATTPDHVIARSFFFEEDRVGLPIVPACSKCNNHKASLEHYATAALLAGSNHVEAKRFRQEEVRPRLEKNQKLIRDCGILEAPKLMLFDEQVEPMHRIALDWEKLKQLIELIAKGLFCFHTRTPLEPSTSLQCGFLRGEKEQATWDAFAEFFPPNSPVCGNNLGRGSFVYRGIQSPMDETLTIWRFAIHNVSVRGKTSPHGGWRVWTTVTMPSIAKYKAA